MIPGRAQQLSRVFDFPVQRRKIRRQERAESLNRLADKRAVGAARGAEGDADVDRKIRGFRQPDSLQRVARGIDTQAAAFRRDEIRLLQKLFCRTFASAFEHAFGRQLRRAHAGQRAPGRNGIEHLNGSKIIALLQKPARPAHIRLHQGEPSCSKARFSAVAHLCRRGQIELPTRKRRYGAVFFKFLRHKFRRFVSEQLHLQLLDRIPLGVTSQQQLHRIASRM